MKVYPHSGKIFTGIVPQHADSQTCRYLPIDPILAKVRQYGDMVGREPAVISVYNEAGAGFTFPMEMCRWIRGLGCTPCVILGQDDVDNTGTWDGEPKPEHWSQNIAAGSIDSVLRDQLARPIAEFGTPVILGFDEPSGFLWGHECQGDPAARPRGFTAAYKRIREVVDAVTPNVTWFLRGALGWLPESADWWRAFKYWWPGPGYVDIVGINIPVYGRAIDGTMLWSTWPTAEESLDAAQQFLAELPGADQIALSLGLGGSEDANRPTYRSSWYAEVIRLCSALPSHLSGLRGVSWLDFWLDDSYVAAGDLTQFPATADAVRGGLLGAAYSSRVGVW